MIVGMSGVGCHLRGVHTHCAAGGVEFIVVIGCCVECDVMCDVM